MGRGVEFGTMGYMPEGQNSDITKQTTPLPAEPPATDTVTFSPHDKRRGAIHSLLEQTPRVEHVKTHTPGVAVVIPIHHDSRLETIEHTFSSLAKQGQKEGEMKLVIGDNGLTDSGGRQLKERAKKYGFGEEDIVIVNAHPTEADHKNAAHARNEAVEKLWILAEQNPNMRTEGIVLVDSDTALLPGAIDSLKQTMKDYKGTVAVSAKNISVPDIHDQAQRHWVKILQATGQREQSRLLTRLYADGNIKADAIIAFGSDAAAKTCGVLVSADALRSLGSRPFVRMPNGSSEDMLFSAGLSALGDLRVDPNAVLLDLARETSEETRKQRANWGRDHAILYSDLLHIGQIQPGVRVLEPRNGAWVEWTVPGTDASGLIINPAQLKEVGADLREIVATHGAKSFGKDYNPEKLHDGLVLLSSIDAYLDNVRPQAQMQERFDLPKPGIADPSETRFSKDALTGLLAGNIMGMDVVRQTEDPIIFYGVRQAAQW